ncbi:MSHA biogenesis protein MshQ [Aliivibrio sp. S2TY2]|uniref:DUF6701 domain-containing protein n=1 Tax=unclassified Aliivibrio TaxID=2645654 RepID=UPI0023781E50|nr:MULTISPECIES: DUF6701 domain-containing protein [unclassified Aliivibrio]MDD9174374.1 MSHA biogenesis protein MshQ [Aliivibrio sp. S3TY1]MDD9191452.1 MSHA biogenesis protein MshQ [Aliivibrio sp. S2TY2]
MTKLFSRSLIISVFSLCLMPLSAFAFPTINPNTYFPGIAQGHSMKCSNPKQLTMYNDAKIEGTQGHSLDFCSSISHYELPDDSCDNGNGGYHQCSITGKNTPALPLPSFQLGNSKKDQTCDSGVLTLNNRKYRNITIRNTCDANIPTHSGTTYIHKLTLESTTITLNAGDYWVENLYMFGFANINVTGNARLFVKNDIELNNDAKITKTGNGSLFVVGYDDISLHDNSYIEGYVYANDKLTLNNQSHIDGRASSRSLFMEGDAYINKTLTPPPTLPAAALSLRLDEDSWNGSIGEVKDSSGNGYDGIAINNLAPQKDNPALPIDVAKMGTCGYGAFNKSQQQYIEVPNNSKLSNEDTITVSAWINPSSYPSSGRLNTIVSKNGNYEFHLNSHGQVNWYWELKNSRYPMNLTTTQSIPKNQWSHVTIRYNAHDRNKASIFINGEKVKSITEDVSPLKHLQVNNQPLQVGNDYDLTRTFNGLIDEVNVFEQALSDEQIEQLYEQRHPCPDVVLPTCYEDNFNSGNLDSNWVTSSSSGSFIPKIINGRLQLTQARRAQSTASSYQYLYPALGNKIEVEFDYMAYGGNGADGLAIVFSDAEITPQAGAFGGPLGYGFKKNSEAVKPGFAGGWLGIGLDEYGNYSKEGGSKNHNSYYTNQSVVLRGSGQQYSGYNYIDGEKVSPNIDGNNGNYNTHRYRITIDSRSNNTANVTVERSVEPKGNTPRFNKIIGPINVLSSQYNQDETPENFIMSLTGSTGQLYNTHEIDNFKVCALYSKPIGEQIDHFEFDHSGQGSTCDVSNVTLRACADASCSSLFTDEIDVTLNTSNLSSDGYWLGGNNITMKNGIANLSIGKPTQGNVSLNVDSSSPSTKPFSNTLCSINGGSLSSPNCTLNFKSEGLTVTVPDKLANKPVTATIKGCGNSFTGTKNIQLWSDYISPTKQNIIGSPSLYGLVNNSWREIGKQEASPTTFTLNFANNEAQIALNYIDAGQLQLNAKYAKSYNQDIEGSDQFVSFPVGLSASVSDKNNSNSNSRCQSEDTSCSIFAHAGEEFNLNIKAHAWEKDNDTNLTDNPVTPNYAQNNLILDHTLIAPAQNIGGNTGNLLVNTYNHAAKQDSTNSFKQSISEVGVFDISITPPPGYLGSNAYQIKAANTGAIGRFIPAYFSLSAEQPTIKNACRTYTYMGQTFVFDTLPTLEITPLSYTGGRLQNYSIGQWWRYNKEWDFRTYSASPSNIKVIDSDSLSILGRRAGFASSGNVIKLPLQNKVQLQNAKLRYNKPFDPISPTNDTITLALTAEDIEDQDGVCYKLNATGNCLNYNFPATPEHQQKWGRITMEDAYGSELNALQSRIETEYYDNGRFVRNTTDSCTELSLSDFSFNVGNDPNALPVGKGITEASFNKAQNTQVKDGLTSMDFTAPGNGNQGQVIPTLSLVNLPWLQQDQDNNDSFEDFIKATIHFGIYRGSDRIIWSHEQTN